MFEKEMEDLLWEHPEKLLNEPLTRHSRQLSSAIGRADLVFEDRIGGLLVVEVKHGKLPREALFQLHDYYGSLKKVHPDVSVELMVVANSIPEERRLACERLDVEAREIPEKRFREVAKQVCYVFQSEASRIGATSRDSDARPRESVAPARSSGIIGWQTSTAATGPAKVERAWHYWEQDDIGYVLALVNARHSCSLRRWDASTGRFVDKVDPNPHGDYQQNFAGYLRSGMALRLSQQPNLERDCKQRLPDWVMDEIAPQIQRFKAR